MEICSIKYCVIKSVGALGELELCGEHLSQLITACANELAVAANARVMKGAREESRVNYTYAILADGYIKVGRSVEPYERIRRLARAGDVSGGVVRPPALGNRALTFQLLALVQGDEEYRIHNALHAMGKHMVNEWFVADRGAVEYCRSLGVVDIPI